MGATKNSTRYNLAGALARFSGDKELLDEAINIFKDDAPEHITKIEMHLGNGNTNEVIPHVHTLKAECGAVGALMAQSLSEKLEKAARDGDYSASKELFDKVKEEVIRAAKELPGLAAI